MGTIRFRCRCGARLESRAEFAGMRMTCPECGGEATIRRPTMAERAVPWMIPVACSVMSAVAASVLTAILIRPAPVPLMSASKGDGDDGRRETASPFAVGTGDVVVRPQHIADITFEPLGDPKTMPINPSDRLVVLNSVYEAKTKNGPLEYWLERAECYLTLEDLKLSISAAWEEDPSLEPDAYCLKVGTAVKVLDTQDFEYQFRGKKIEIWALRILVLDGEFKGQTLYVRTGHVVRLIDGPGGRPGR